METISCVSNSPHSASGYVLALFSCWKRNDSPTKLQARWDGVSVEDAVVDMLVKYCLESLCKYPTVSPARPPPHTHTHTITVPPSQPRTKDPIFIGLTCISCVLWIQLSSSSFYWLSSVVVSLHYLVIKGLMLMRLVLELWETLMWALNLRSH